jgi:iron(III) transport system substrate-binding protein
LQSYLFSVEAQQLMVDFGGLRSVHKLIKEHAGRKPLGEIKTLKDDAAAVERLADEIKAKYTSYFKV